MIFDVFNNDVLSLFAHQKTMSSFRIAYKTIESAIATEKCIFDEKDDEVSRTAIALNDLLNDWEFNPTFMIKASYVISNLNLTHDEPVLFSISNVLYSFFKKYDVDFYDSEYCIMFTSVLDCISYISRVHYDSEILDVFTRIIEIECFDIDIKAIVAIILKNYLLTDKWNININDHNIMSLIKYCTTYLINDEVEDEFVFIELLEAFIKKNGTIDQDDIILIIDSFIDNNQDKQLNPQYLSFIMKLCMRCSIDKDSGEKKRCKRVLVIATNSLISSRFMKTDEFQETLNQYLVFIYQKTNILKVKAEKRVILFLLNNLNDEISEELILLYKYVITNCRKSNNKILIQLMQKIYQNFKIRENQKYSLILGYYFTYHQSLKHLKKIITSYDDIPLILMNVIDRLENESLEYLIDFSKSCYAFIKDKGEYNSQGHLIYSTLCEHFSQEIIYKNELNEIIDKYEEYLEIDYD